MADIVGIAVFEAVITSSPFFIPRDIKDINKASVPLPTATPYFKLYFLTKFFSKLIKLLPKKVAPELNDLSIIFKILLLFFSYSLYRPKFNHLLPFLNFQYS